MIDQRNTKSIGIVFVNCEFFLDKSTTARFPLKPIRGFFPIYKFPNLNGKAEKVGELEIDVHMREAVRDDPREADTKEPDVKSHREDLTSKKEELIRTMNEARQFLVDQDIGQKKGEGASEAHVRVESGRDDPVRAEMGSGAEKRSFGQKGDRQVWRLGEDIEAKAQDEDELVQCKSRTATLEAELFQLKNKYRDFLGGKSKEKSPEKAATRRKTPEQPIRSERVTLDYRVKIETMSVMSAKLEEQLSKYNCILETEIQGEGRTENNAEKIETEPS